MEPYHYPDDGPVAFRRERDLGDVIRAAILWMRETAGVWIPAVAAIGGPLYLASALLGAFVGDAVSIVSLLDGIAGLLVSAATFGLLRLYRIGEAAPDIGSVWEEAKTWVGPLFLFGLVTVLFAFVALIPFGIVLAVVGGDNPSVGLMATLGLLLLVLMIAVAPYYALGLVSRMFDEDGAVDAYKRAAGLVSAHRGLATGTTFVTFGIVYFVIFLIGGGIEAVLFGLGASGVLRAVGTVLTVLAIVPASVFGSVASTFLFEALVEREEGTLLDAEIEAIRDHPGSDRPDERPAPAPVVAEPEPPDTRSFAQRQLDARARDAGPDDPGEAAPDAHEPPRTGGFRGGGFDDAG